MSSWSSCVARACRLQPISGVHFIEVLLMVSRHKYSKADGGVCLDPAAAFDVSRVIACERVCDVNWKAKKPQ